MKWRPFTGDLEERVAKDTAVHYQNGYQDIPCPSC
jgi:hypothetical protein